MSDDPPFDFVQIFLPIIDAFPIALVVLDDRGRLVWSNRAWRELGAWETEGDRELAFGEAYVESVGSYMSFDRREIRDLVSGIRAVCDGREDYFDTVCTSRRGQRTRQLQIKAIPLSIAERRLILVTHRDADALQPNQVAAELFRQALIQIDEPFLIADREGLIEFANPAHARFSGILDTELIGKSLWSLAHEERDRGMVEAAWNALRAGKSWQERLSVRRPNGELRWQSRIVSPLHDGSGRLTHLVASGRDITDHRAYVDDLRRRAYYDALTGLPNRVLFLDRLRHAHTRVRRGNRPLAVMFLDLNEFKSVNDQFGHQFGDVVLAEISRRLIGCLRASDTVARASGDEFIFLLEEVASDDDATAVARRVISEISRPLEINNVRVSVSGAIGIAFNTLAITDPELLLHLADVALYHAKLRSDDKVVIYRENMTMPDRGTS